jgi:hypothetical protein
MDIVKKILGILSIVIGIGAEYLLITTILSGKLFKTVEENQIFAWTVIPVSIPIIFFGLVLFGYYAVKGEYCEVTE